MAEILLTVSAATKTALRQVAYDANFRRTNLSGLVVGNINAMLKAYIVNEIQAARQKVIDDARPAVDMSDVSITDSGD